MTKRTNRTAAADSGTTTTRPARQRRGKATTADQDPQGAAVAPADSPDPGSAATTAEAPQEAPQVAPVAELEAVDTDATVADTPPDPADAPQEAPQAPQGDPRGDPAATTAEAPQEAPTAPTSGGWNPWLDLTRLHRVDGEPTIKLRLAANNFQKDLDVGEIVSVAPGKKAGSRVGVVRYALSGSNRRLALAVIEVKDEHAAVVDMLAAHGVDTAAMPSAAPTTTRTGQVRPPAAPKEPKATPVRKRDDPAAVTRLAEWIKELHAKEPDLLDYKAQQAGRKAGHSFGPSRWAAATAEAGVSFAQSTRGQSAGRRSIERDAFNTALFNAFVEGAQSNSAPADRQAAQRYADEQTVAVYGPLEVTAAAPAA
jgi:hypothetical protein